MSCRAHAWERARQRLGAFLKRGSPMLCTAQDGAKLRQWLNKKQAG